MHDDNMKLINKVNYGMKKAIEYAQGTAALISKIITIIRKSPIRYKFQYTLSYIGKVEYYRQNPLVFLIQKCNANANKIRRQLQNK